MGALGRRPIHTVFLDRDGTINVKAADGEYVRAPADLVLLPGAARAVAALNAAGLRTILVTNQRWLSAPGTDSADYGAVHARLRQLLAAEGAWLDAVYHCPHPAGVCGCRKPGAGMLLRAAREHGFDLAGAVIVGDSGADMMAGRSAGMATVFIRAHGAGAGCGGEADAVTGAGGGYEADAVADDLSSAVRLILQSRAGPAGPAEPGAAAGAVFHAAPAGS